MQLEVGDKIYVQGPLGREIVITIERVTKTAAIAGKWIFSREYDKYPRIKPSVFGWDAQIATPKIIDRIAEKKKRKALIARIHGSLVETLPTEDLEQIVALINWKLKEKVGE